MGGPDDSNRLFGWAMKRFIPARAELIFFVVLAVVCGGIVKLSPSHDYALAVLAMPVFLIASLMGLRRSGAFSAVPVAEDEEPTAS